MIYRAALACALFAAACSSGTLAIGHDMAGARDLGPRDQSPPDLTPVSKVCNGTRQPLDSMWTVHFGGVDRPLGVHVPATYDGRTPTPVVFNFHGYTSNGDQQAWLSNMIQKSDQAGFIAVHPNGIGNSWNAGVCCGQAAQTMVDDVGYVNRLLDIIAGQLCIDPKRVFATGLSNGGFLSHRLACESAGRFAAIAPVAGVMGIPMCKPSRAVPVLGFHGTADAIVPYGGSVLLGFPPAPDTYAGWAMRDGCGTSTKETFRMADSHCSTWLSCPGTMEVTFCTVDGGGHTWPGGQPLPTGYTTMNIIATDVMWDFFMRHPLP
jgi:polyhydroxybutyrate depolymerase